MLGLFHASLPELIRGAGYLGLFFIVFAESGLPFGFIFPGDSLLFTAGFLASQGFLAIVPLVCLMTLAAILGDTAGYWFGATLGKKYLGKPGAWFMNDQHVAKTEAFFAKYGVRAVILARFVPTVRTFVPIFAGIGGMKYRTFLSYNVIGGILWGAGVTLLGYFLGSVFPASERYLTLIIIAILVISTAPVAIELLKHYRRPKS